MTSKIAFLGLCERSAYVRDGNTNLFKWNILGLKQNILTHIFPISLNGWSLTLALHSSVTEDITIKIVDKNKKDVGYVNLRMGVAIKQGDSTPEEDGEGRYVLLPDDGWNIFSVPIANNDLTIFQPGTYTLLIDNNEKNEVIGQLNYYLVEPPALTPERIIAIKSDPTATKALRIFFSCKECTDGLKAYTALERDEKLEKEGFIWYADLEDEFKCKCNKTVIDTSYVKKNFHGLLGAKNLSNKEIGNVPLYERSSLEDILSRYQELIKNTPPEEKIQKFIENNPIILHQFPAHKIIFKAPILNKFNTDFVILTPQKELIVIEIEKANTKLLKKDGHITANLNHAFEQVRDWLHCIDEHRLAILEDMNIDKNSVSIVKGVVIAGVDSGYDAAHLRKLKGADWGRITFLTFDDLTSALNSLIRNIHGV